MVMHEEMRLLAVIALVVTAGLGVLRRQREARVEATWLGTPAAARRPGPGALGQAPALAAVVAAVLVSPSVPGGLPPSSTGGQPIVFALDVSRSMDVDDAMPSRAGAAEGFLARTFTRPGAPESGLVVFAGEAVLVAPVTRDAGALVRALDEVGRLRKTLVGGSSLAAAIDRAVQAVPVGRTASVVLLTDGEDTGGGVDAAVTRAAERGVVVHAMGIGSAEGRSMTVARGSESAQRRVTRLDPRRLADIAARTGGQYQVLGAGSSEAAYIVTASTPAPARAAPLPLWQRAGLGLMLVLLAWDAPGGRRGRGAAAQPRVAKGRAGQAARATAAAVLAALLLWASSSVVEARQTSAIDEGLAALAAGVLDVAETAFERASLVDETADIATFDLGLVRARQGRMADAATAFTAVLTRTSSVDIRRRAQFNRGVALAEAGRLQEALDDFADVLRGNPSDDAARRNYAITKARLARGPRPPTPSPPKPGRSSPDLPSQNYKFNDARRQPAPARVRSDW